MNTTLPSFDTWVQSRYPDDLSGRIDLRVVSCPAPYGVNNTWTDTTPTTDMTWTVTATGTGYSAPGYLWMSVTMRTDVM